MSASMLSESHMVNLLSVDFLCRLCQHTDNLLPTDCVFASLVKLIDCDNEETSSCLKAFDVHLVSASTLCLLYGSDNGNILAMFRIEFVWRIMSDYAIDLTEPSSLCLISPCCDSLPHILPVC